MSNAVDLFLATNANKFPPEQMAMVRQHFESLDESRQQMAMSLPYKDPTIALVISLFVGVLGVDRFYLGDIGMGVGKLLTAGGCGIWSIVDWFLIMGAAKKKNMEQLMSIR